MGDNETTSIPLGPTNIPDFIYTAYCSHSSGQRTHTDTAIQSALRDAYPSHHIVATPCNLLAYAKAGHATAHLHPTAPPPIRTRDYVSPSSRLTGTPHLTTTDTFAAYAYTWRNEAFTVYVAQAQGAILDPPKPAYYIVREAGPAGGEVMVDALLLAANAWAERATEEVWVFDQGDWRKDKELWATVRDAEWGDLVMGKGMKEGIVRDVEGFFGAREQYARFRTPWKRGLIFHGSPGNGKTMTVKAIMKSLMTREDPVPILYVKTFAQRGCGPQQSVRQVFEKARAAAPCLLLFEDVDSLVKDEVRSYFLNEIDGLENNDGILMIGSTNDLDKLDLGLSKRPSRFDRKYRFKTPSMEERVRYCDMWRAKFAEDPELHTDAAISRRVAELTEGFSFAYLKEAWVASLLTLLYETTAAGAESVSGRLSKTLERQIEILRVEMGEGGKDAGEEEKEETHPGDDMLGV